MVPGTRGIATNDRPAFTVTDRKCLSACWPGDAYLFARRFSALLASTTHQGGYMAVVRPAAPPWPLPRHERIGAEPG